MNDPLSDFFSDLAKQPVSPEFEQRLHRRLFARSVPWPWVLAPAVATYLLISCLSYLPEVGNQRANRTTLTTPSQVMRVSLIGRRL
ncbi:MAG: hypothetical protein ABL949_15280 [Fimbriimonadaceae bacterium]